MVGGVVGIIGDDEKVVVLGRNLGFCFWGCHFALGENPGNVVMISQSDTDL